jgi:hypothetical protein
MTLSANESNVCFEDPIWTSNPSFFKKFSEGTKDNSFAKS